MSVVQEDRVWQTILGDIEITLSRANYLTWFKNTRVVKQTDTELVVGVPNIFIKNQLEVKYSQLIQDTIHKNGLPIETVVFKIQTTNRRDEPEPVPPPQANPLPVKPQRRAALALLHS